MHYFIVVLIAFALSMYGCEGKTGPAGSTGAAGVAGPTGLAGPAGPTGPQGSTGPQGPKGDKGDKGETGDVGPAGADGADGATGPQGEKGDTGETGPAGADGADGATGPQGEKGDTGETGPAGADGADGATGPQGPQGEKGDTGETGPAGADGAKGDKGDQGDQGDKGDQGDPGDPASIDPADFGNILADVHHILLLKDGETDPDKGTVIMSSDFSDAKVTVGLLNGQSTTYVAKAAAANKEAIPVTFTWTSDDEQVASVINGTISSHRKGKAEITLAVDGRGINVKFDVTVHDVVKGIIASTGDDTTIAIDDVIEVSAVAYDKAQDADMAGAEGTEVPNVTFTWKSSNTAVAAVDEDGMVTGKAAGTTDITAHVGDVTSNKVKVTVFDILTVERRLRITNLPIAGTYVGVGDSTTADLTADPVVYTAVAEGGETTSLGADAIVVVVEQFDPNVGDNGTWSAVDVDEAMVKFVSLDTDVLTFQDTDEASGAMDADYKGEVTIATAAAGAANMSFAADNTNWGKVVGRGDARVEISTQYADTRYIEVKITLPDTGKAGS